ncbi:hypothetical protein THAOC_22479, partial [Thalassiosira oceanica]
MLGLRSVRRRLQGREWSRLDPELAKQMRELDGPALRGLLNGDGKPRRAQRRREERPGPFSGKGRGRGGHGGTGIPVLTPGWKRPQLQGSQRGRRLYSVTGHGRSPRRRTSVRREVEERRIAAECRDVADNDGGLSGREGRAGAVAASVTTNESTPPGRRSRPASAPTPVPSPPANARTSIKTGGGHSAGAESIDDGLSAGAVWLLLGVRPVDLVGRDTRRWNAPSTTREPTGGAGAEPRGTCHGPQQRGAGAAVAGEASPPMPLQVSEELAQEAEPAEAAGEEEALCRPSDPPRRDPSAGGTGTPWIGLGEDGRDPPEEKAGELRPVPPGAEGETAASHPTSVIFHPREPSPASWTGAAARPRPEAGWRTPGAGGAQLFSTLSLGGRQSGGRPDVNRIGPLPPT